jgi:hypothetical protein
MATSTGSVATTVPDGPFAASEVHPCAAADKPSRGLPLPPVLQRTPIAAMECTTQCFLRKEEESSCSSCRCIFGAVTAEPLRGRGCRSFQWTVAYESMSTLFSTCQNSNGIGKEYSYQKSQSSGMFQVRTAMGNDTKICSPWGMAGGALGALTLVAVAMHRASSPSARMHAPAAPRVVPANLGKRA